MSQVDEPRSSAPVRRRRWVRWAIGIVAGLAVLTVAVVGAIWWITRPATPGAFYSAPRDVPAAPGALLRSAPYTQAVPAGARAWRILYTTTRDEGVPAIASAVVLAASDLPAGPRPVIAWAHGTTGAVPGCAPTVLRAPSPFGPHIPALDQVIANGWIWVATDYIGLGTKGPHPYLIGQGEARSVLDAVRAARQMPELSLEDRTIVWGHSQGGHAALWTGILAPGYAPDVNVIGVAAFAPAADISALVEGVKDTLPGKVIAAFVMRAWTETYPEIRFDDLIRREVRGTVRSIGGRCLAGPATFLSAVQADMRLEGTIFVVDPTGYSPMAARMNENTPHELIAAPLLIAQGLDDPLVLPSVQETFVQQRCAAGQRLEYRTYAGRDHLSVVAADSPLNADLARWTEDRLMGAPQPPGCETISG